MIYITYFCMKVTLHGCMAMGIYTRQLIVRLKYTFKAIYTIGMFYIEFYKKFSLKSIENLVLGNVTIQ